MRRSKQFERHVSSSEGVLPRLLVFAEQRRAREQKERKEKVNNALHVLECVSTLSLAPLTRIQAAEEKRIKAELLASYEHSLTLSDDSLSIGKNQDLERLIELDQEAIVQLTLRPLQSALNAILQENIHLNTKSTHSANALVWTRSDREKFNEPFERAVHFVQFVKKVFQTRSKAHENLFVLVGKQLARSMLNLLCGCLDRHIPSNFSKLDKRQREFKERVSKFEYMLVENSKRFTATQETLTNVQNGSNPWTQSSLHLSRRSTNISSPSAKNPISIKRAR